MAGRRPLACTNVSNNPSSHNVFSTRRADFAGTPEFTKWVLPKIGYWNIQSNAWMAYRDLVKAAIRDFISS